MSTLYITIVINSEEEKQDTKYADMLRYFQKLIKIKPK